MVSLKVESLSKIMRWLQFASGTAISAQNKEEWEQISSFKVWMDKNSIDFNLSVFSVIKHITSKKVYLFMIDIKMGVH